MRPSQAIYSAVSPTSVIWLEIVTTLEKVVVVDC